MSLYLLAVAAQAAPWLEPGDMRARHALQKLADRGHLQRTVTTWPFMLEGLESGLDPAGAADDMRAVGTGLAYLRFEREARTAPGVNGTLQLAASSEPAFVRGFAAEPREPGEVNLTLEYIGPNIAAAFSPSYVVDPQDDESLRLDGSYFAATAYDWVLGAGAIERWWGPGWQSSLVLSGNARPVPAVWLNRRAETAFESKWLAWIGPWQFTAFAGQLEKERAVPDARLIGMRLTLRPVQGLDIGFSRAIQWGGEGRPQGASSLWSALIGRDNGQLGPENEPGNQLGTIDMRYGLALGDQTLGVYLQVTGEDEAGAFPSRKSWLVGADWTTQWGRSDQQWFVEGVNTIADDVTGTPKYNYAFEHHIYRSGYRHYGRNMAPAFEPDARALSLGVFNFFADGRNVGLSLSYADLNVDGANGFAQAHPAVDYWWPTSHQKVIMTQLSYGQELLGGWLKLDAQLADKQLKLQSGDRDRWSLGGEWTYRFW